MKSSKKRAPKPLDLCAAIKLLLPTSGMAEGTGGSAEVKQERAGTPEEWRPGPLELATLATLMAINHSIQHTDAKMEPINFLSAAFTLLKEAERSLAYQMIVEGMNKLAGIHSRPDDPLSRKYSWKEALAVQTEAPKGRSSVSRFVVGAPAIKYGSRIRSDKEFGPVTFHHDDLVNRPAGISMVGSIGTEKGLRNAIKRVFPKEAREIIARKTLTQWEINQILDDQLKTHNRRIPQVRPAKTKTVT
jgi:hypothetical protein